MRERECVCVSVRERETVCVCEREKKSRVCVYEWDTSNCSATVACPVALTLFRYPPKSYTLSP